jgi:MAF protein
MTNLILASNSPRRRELLMLLEWPFEVLPADVDESQLPDENPVDYVSRLACEKARAVAEIASGVVLAADTIVVDGQELLGKPVDPADARKMLERLRGRTHQVYSGIALIDTRSGKAHQGVCCTNVPMRAYSDAEVDAYIATGDPMDKAGAYAIQHPGFHPVEGLVGCYASVMGLPLCHLLVGLRALGFTPPVGLPQRCQAFLGYDCPVYSSILAQPSGAKHE